MSRIILKRGRGKPKPDDLKLGEVAIDLKNMCLVTKDDHGKIVKLCGIVIGPYDKRLYGRVVGDDSLIPLGMDLK